MHYLIIYLKLAFLIVIETNLAKHELEQVFMLQINEKKFMLENWLCSPDKYKISIKSYIRINEAFKNCTKKRTRGHSKNCFITSLPLIQEQILNSFCVGIRMASLKPCSCSSIKKSPKWRWTKLFRSPWLLFSDRKKQNLFERGKEIRHNF